MPVTSRAWLVLVVLAATTPAAAQPRGDAKARQAAKLRYKEGQKLYNLGKFAEAAVEFEAAFTTHPDEVYLFNLAQAFRLAGNRERALFFYRRFVEIVPSGPLVDEIKQHIAVLEAELAAQERAAADRAAVTAALAAKAAAEQQAAHEVTARQRAEQATEAARADAKKLAAAKAEAEGREATAKAELAKARAPKPIRLRLGMGAGLDQITLKGDQPDMQSPMQLVGGASFAFVWHRGSLAIDVGLLSSFSSYPYVAADGKPGAALYNQQVFFAAATYPIAGRFSVRGSFGAGTCSFALLETGNPLTTDMGAAPDRRLLCIRADTFVLVRLGTRTDLAIGPASLSWAWQVGERRLVPDRVTTFESFYFGLLVGF